MDGADWTDDAQRIAARDTADHLGARSSLTSTVPAEPAGTLRLTAAVLTTTSDVSVHDRLAARTAASGALGWCGW